METRTLRSTALFAATALAWSDTGLAQATEATQPGLAAGAIQMVLGLALVLALLIGSLWLLRRLSAGGGAGSGLLRVIGGVAVGPRERVVLVEVGETWLVLGVAPGQVSTLHQLPRAETPAAAASTVPAGSFRGWLDSALEHRHGTR
jgi:flagellar protein FliO/FliZ